MARKPLRATPTRGMPIPLDEALRNGDDNFIELYAGIGGPGGAVASVNGQTGVVVLTASDVGAAQTSDITAAVAALVDSSPGTLDTLNELAAALGDDPNFATTIAASIAGKQPIDSDLTAIAGLTPSNDDLIQRKAGAWINRTMAQVKADLALAASATTDTTVATNIATGTLADARLSANVALRNAGNSYSVAQLTSAGTNALPSWSFSGDPNTGIYSSAADTIGITTGGVLRGSISTTGFFFNIMPVLVGGTGLNGSVTAPSLAWGNDTNSGWYRIAEDSIGMTVGGTLRTTYGNTETTSAVNISLSVLGNKLLIKEGTNAAMGLAALSGGTVTVNNTLVTANSRIMLTPQDGSANVGSVWISARTAATSFTISSSNVLDARNVAWQIIEPAP